MFKKLYEKDLIPPETITMTHREALEQYMAGKIVFYQGGANFLNMIKEKKTSENVELYLEDFNNIDKFNYANTIIFNLGFLPGSNRKVKTQDYTSDVAVLNAYQILDGIMLVACYVQHDGG